jgi:N-acetylglucosaminyl-diphospho-decaprenol L-rhamnosyltransferase
MTLPMGGLTVVTVLYRSREMLAQTLPTWRRSAQGLGVHFVFVDHSPDDGSEALLAELLDPELYTYLPNSDNPGFAGGSNRGVAAATGSHVMLLNADVWLPEDGLTNVVKAIAANPERPIAVGLAMDGGQFAGIDVSPIGLFVDRPAQASRGPLGPSGGAAVFPIGLYQRFGGLYEQMFAWGEDADLAFRLYAAGVRTTALNLALPHAKGHSVVGDSRLSGFRAYLLARNRVLVGARTFSLPLLVLGLPVAVAAHAALAVRRARQGLLLPFLRGVGKGIVQAPAARRRAAAPRFTVADLVGYVRGGRV